jgi:hypothetical protein
VPEIAEEFFATTDVANQLLIGMEVGGRGWWFAVNGVVDDIDIIEGLS